MINHRTVGPTATFIVSLCFSLAAERIHAGSATWDSNPPNADWNYPLNWSPPTVPNGPADTATFGISSESNIFLSADTEVNAIMFEAVVDSYTITISPALKLTVSGEGITNSSIVSQSFVAGVDGAGRSGEIEFTHQASAGDSTMFTASGAQVRAITSFSPSGGLISFFDSSNAGQGTFQSHGGAIAAGLGGLIAFYNNSTASHGVFTARGGGVLNAIGGVIEFYDTATADRGTFTNQGGSALPKPSGDGIPVVDLSLGGEMRFHGSSTAGEASFTNNGGEVDRAGGSFMRFYDSSTASDATITNDGGKDIQTTGGAVAFYDSSTAGNAIMVNNAGVPGAFNGGITAFGDSSTAGNASLIASGGLEGGYGGQILFGGDSNGGTARVQVYGNGNIDISSHNGPGLTIGSLEGTGVVFLGGKILSIGNSNSSTLFAGEIRANGYFDPQATGGELTKIGAGALTLSGTSTYTGATRINAGELVVNGAITSDVTVNGGALGGSGVVGAVTVNPGGTLAPGDSLGILSVRGDLTLTLGATYLVDLNGTAIGTQYDQTNVAGAVSLGNSTLSLSLAFAPAAGDKFKIINNDATDPISGTFGELAEGGLYRFGGQTFTISYQGGDGNDAVLTSVIPEPAAWALLTTGGALLAHVLRQRRSSC